MAWHYQDHMWVAAQFSAAPEIIVCMIDASQGWWDGVHQLCFFAVHVVLEGGRVVMRGDAARHNGRPCYPRPAAFLFIADLRQNKLNVVEMSASSSPACFTPLNQQTPAGLDAPFDMCPSRAFEAVP